MPETSLEGLTPVLFAPSQPLFTFVFFVSNADRTGTSIPVSSKILDTFATMVACASACNRTFLLKFVQALSIKVNWGHSSRRLYVGCGVPRRTMPESNIRSSRDVKSPCCSYTRLRTYSSYESFPFRLGIDLTCLRTIPPRPKHTNTIGLRRCFALIVSLHEHPKTWNCVVPGSLVLCLPDYQEGRH